MSKMRNFPRQHLVQHFFSLGLCLGLVVVFLSGCGAFGKNVIVVTATPSLAPSATFVPVTSTPLPIPTTVPSPTPAPFTQIGLAETALHNGDYQKAVTVFREVLAQPELSIDPTLRAQAAYGLGEAALREGLFTDAVAAITEFIRLYPKNERYGQAYFLRGDAYLGLSQWEDAIKDFQQYLALRPGIIDSYAYERIGDAYLALGNPSQALASYDLAVKSSRGLQPLLKLQEKTAAGYLNVRNVQKAVEQYDGILTTAQDDSYKAVIALRAADALARFGNSAAALARYQTIIANYPETLSGYRAMQALLASGLQVDNLLRGRISYIAEDYNDAITALYRYTSTTPLGKIDPQVYLLLGRSYRAVSNIQAANTAFQTLIDQYPATEFFGEAWLEQGRTLFLMGNVEGAINRYRELAEKHPTVPQGAEALWRAGYLYSTLGNTEQSLATFEILGNKYPGTTQATDGLFRAGMAAYNINNPARAQRLFSLLATTGTGELKAAGYLWLGRLYQLSNQPDLARIAYAEAAKADPGGYYSLRAADLLAGTGPFVPPPRIDWSFSSPQHVDAAEAWMRETFKIQIGGALWPLSAELAADPRMIKGLELLSVAAYDDARGEFNALREANKQNPLALYQLSTMYHRLGFYREGIEAAAILIDGAKIQTYQAPKFIAALRYPIAYYDLVLPAAKQYNLDPLLAFSLIRQESLFQGFATSYAQAQGLMQVIPSTGAYIAQKLSWPNYQNSDLYRPYINVPFGMYYLYEQMQTFNQNVYAALAAYNGGPGNSATWLRISNGDPDLFVQAIDFEETRTYVRRIYEQYDIYRLIYGVK